MKSYSSETRPLGTIPVLFLNLETPILVEEGEGYQDKDKDDDDDNEKDHNQDQDQDDDDDTAEFERVKNKDRCKSNIMTKKVTRIRRMNMRKKEQEEENTQQQASSSVTHTTFVSDTPVSFYSSVSPYAILIRGGDAHVTASPCVSQWMSSSTITTPD